MSLTLTLKDNGGNPVSGEGTSITLNNTTETNFTKFDLYGDTEQQTYSGKNLAKITDCDVSSTSYTLKIANDTVQITSTNANNWFDLCAGARTAAWAQGYSDAPDYHLTSADGGTYTVKWWNFTGTNTSSGYNQFRVITNQRTIYNYYWNGQGANPSTQSFTLQTDEYIKMIGVWVREDTVATMSFKVQLEKSESATSFEPYVGGIASPNPDYPQEVKTVTGEQTITVSNGQGESQVYPINFGKNILDNYNPTVVSNNTTWIPTANGGLYTATSGWTGGVQWKLTVEEGATYQFQYKERTDLNLYLYITTYTDATYTTVKTQIVNDGRYTKYPIVPDSPYLKISFNNSAAMTNVAIEELMFEKAPVRTTYAPYITAFGKNLLNTNTFVKGRIDNGSIGYASDTSDLSTTNTTISFTTTSGYRGVASALIPVKPNTTYISSVGSATTGMGSYADFYDATGAWISRSSSGITISTPATCVYIRVSYQLNSAGTGTITNPMVEESSSATTFEPNMSGQLELCEIGDYQDYLYKSEGNWYIHKETAKVDFGTLTWTTTVGYIVGTTDCTGIKYAATNQELIPSYAEKYIGRKGSGLSNFWYYYAIDTSKVNVNRGANGTNPTGVFYYPLASATNYQITFEPLVAQLEALYNTAHSYNGATIVTSSSQYLPAIMDVTVGGSINEVTYTETELSNPLTITDIEGKSQNTTLNGNIYVDYVYNKKSFSVSIFNLKAADYATIRGFYDRQFTLNEFPLLSIPELNISEMPVFFEIGSREINSQCIVTDKLTLKFRETAQQ